jgi:hypothetical protein
MIHRGPGFLAVVWFGSSPTSSSSLPPESSTGKIEKEDMLLTVEGGRGMGRII